MMMMNFAEKYDDEKNSNTVLIYCTQLRRSQTHGTGTVKEQQPFLTASCSLPDTYLMFLKIYIE